MNQLPDLTTYAAAAILATVCAAGCHTNPAADQQIALAKASVARAEQAGATQEAAVELATARDKLARAEKATDDHHSEPEALPLAEQANIDAQVAEATALQHRSHKAAVDFDASMQALQDESQRNSQDSQAQ